MASYSSSRQVELKRCWRQYVKEPKVQVRMRKDEPSTMDENSCGR